MDIWSTKYLRLLVRLQWVDRRATSSFIVGMTVQTVILALGLTQLQDADASTVLQAAFRAALLVGIALCSLSAMSAFQNEFRYETIWQTARQPRILRRLLLARSFAMVVITAPALVVPFVVAVIVGRSAVPIGVVVAMFLLTLASLTAFTHVLTLALMLAYDPARLVPWVRQVTMAVVVGAVAFLSPEPVRRAFPFVWIEDLALADHFWTSFGIAGATTVAWWLGSALALRRATRDVVERRLLDNVEIR